jgi:nucleoside-diphosphate-sugar epimerase
MLAKRGYEVVGIDSDLYAGCDFSPLLSTFPEIIKDIRDVSASDLRGCEVVMHLAALSNDPVCDIDPAPAIDINYNATVALAGLAKQAGVQRFIFASSCSNYGAAVDTPLDEEAPLRPLTVYGESKVRAEQSLAALADDRFSPVFLRNATAYGVSPRLRLDLVLNDFCAHAVAAGKIIMQSDGTSWRPLVHVSDIARAFIAVAESPRPLVHNEIFNVGNTSENYRIRDVAEMVARAVPGCTVAQAGSAGPDKRSYRVDCSKIANKLSSFKPQHTVASGIQELVSVFRSHATLASDLTSDRYRRILRIRSQSARGLLDKNLRVGRSTEEMLKK